MIDVASGDQTYADLERLRVDANTYSLLVEGEESVAALSAQDRVEDPRLQWFMSLAQEIGRGLLFGEYTRSYKKLFGRDEDEHPFIVEFDFTRRSTPEDPVTTVVDLRLLRYYDPDSLIFQSGRYESTSSKNFPSAHEIKSGYLAGAGNGSRW